MRYSLLAQGDEGSRCQHLAECLVQLEIEEMIVNLILLYLGFLEYPGHP